MNTEEIISELNGIRLKCHHEKASSGFHFNIFEILNLSTNEVRTHSAFISELLDRKGRHGQGDVFLRIFLSLIEIQNFDTENSRVEIETYIGEINDDKTEGGRLDIFIATKNSPNIIIENKIYAVDQTNQLLRYSNFDPSATLIYLTLDGRNSSEQFEGQNVIALSYSQDITRWLEECILITNHIPVIKETLSQYLNLIRKLTQQYALEDMEKEIYALLIKNPDYALTIQDSYNALNAIKNKIRKSFFTRIKEHFPDRMSTEESMIKVNQDLFLCLCLDEDSSGVYLGYRLYQNGWEVNNSELGRKYAKYLQALDRRFVSNKNWIGWIIPEPFQTQVRFIDHDFPILNQFNQENENNELDAFVTAIKEFESTTTAQLKNFMLENYPD
jgi:hypothetical protein